MAEQDGPQPLSATPQRPAGRGSAVLPLRRLRRAARHRTPPEPSRAEPAVCRGAQERRGALTAAAVLTCTRRSGTAEPRGLCGLRRGSRSPRPPARPPLASAVRPTPATAPRPERHGARSPAPPARRHRGQPMGAAAGVATHWLGRLSLSSAAAINGAVSQNLPQRLRREWGTGVVSWSAAFGSVFLFLEPLLGICSFGRAPGKA